MSEESTSTDGRVEGRCTVCGRAGRMQTVEDCWFDAAGETRRRQTLCREHLLSWLVTLSGIPVEEDAE